MPFHLEAIVGGKTLLEDLADRMPSAKVRAFAQELSLIPLTSAVKEEAQGGGVPFPGLALSERLIEWVREASGKGSLAYIEAHYSEGSNHQASLVWSKGKVSLGPLVEDAAWDPRENNEDRPVNKALRALGLKPEEYDDEWDAAGMTRHSTTEAWAET